ncbi:MAG: hypothetical protein WBE26_11475 [Phycisphaerae bacterium]
MVKRQMLALFVLVSVLFGCASSGRTSSKSTETSILRARVKKVAIVSLIVRNYGIYGTMGMIPSNLITDNMNNVLASTERTIRNYWSVKPINSFIYNPDYTTLAKGSARANYFTPRVNGQDMPIFSNDRKDLIKGTIGKGTAQELCSILSVDAIVLVYSEWSLQSGKFIPTVKALTKNCITMYDKSGKHLFFGRKDTLGSHPIGGPYAGIHINEDTIGHWLEAYETGAKTVVEKYHKRLR